MRASRATIHLGNARHNLRVIREYLDRVSRSAGGRSPAMCVSVKANAYGHGAEELAKLAAEEGVDQLAVATVDEAVRLRDAGVSAPMVLYSLSLPEEADEVCAAGLAPFVADQEYCDRLAEAARRHHTTVAVHLKVDTGMGRIGCSPADAPVLARRIHDDPNLRLAGIATHFPVADDADRDFTEHQCRLFTEVVRRIRGSGVTDGLVHAANSGAVLAYPEAWFDLVRPGIMVYGYYPSHDQARDLDLRPVMELESRIVQLKTIEPGTSISYGRTYVAHRQTVIGTVPVGYADGYNRLLSNCGSVLVWEDGDRRARRVPIAGRVCMDQIMLDLGPAAPTRKHDRVVLFGPDPRGPSAEEIADLIGTIPYEVTCAVAGRVPRVYVDS